ncbi:hypothetical protein IJ750_04565 [bacterium]|nr:hypothetical protein [bacterium]
MYYAFIQNNKINGVGQCMQLTQGVENFEISEEVFNTIDHYIWDGENIVLNPNYEEEQEEKERERLDSLTLTPADVERALYKAKSMDFEDLKALIAEQIPTVDLKGLAIEFRAKDFYRGAIANGMRLFDVVGALLGYTPQDMDYLFEHKELPNKPIVEAE